MRIKKIFKRIIHSINSRISHRLAIIFSVLMIGLSLIISIVMFQYLNSLMLKQNIARSQQSLKQCELQIENLSHEIDILGKNIITDEAIIKYCISDEEYDLTYDAIKAINRYTNSLDVIHSSVIITKNRALWNLYPLDDTYNQLINDDWYLNGTNGFSDVYNIKFGNHILSLISYRLNIIETNNPNNILGTLLINIDVQSLDNWLTQISDESQDIALYMNDKLLIGSDIMPNTIQNQIEDKIKYQSGYLLSTSIGDGRLKVASYVSNDYLFSNFNKILSLFILTSIGVSIIFIYICVVIIKKAMKPIDDLTSAINEFASGNLKTQVEIKTEDEFAILGKNFNSMVLSINNLLEETIEDEKIKKKLKFDMMISKIHPHFIYNTLNSVIILARKQGNNDVVEMVKSLILILQDGMSIHKDLLYDTIANEIEIIKAYVTIQNYRYKDKINLDIEIAESLVEYKIAKNILEPIVENAIFHGIVPKSGKGNILLSINKVDDKLIINVADDGVGINETIANDIERGASYLSSKNDNSVHSIALVNVCERLEFLYGKKSHISVKGIKEKGTTFIIEVPII